MPTPATDEALKAQLARYLEQLEAGVKTGGDFVAQQVPDIVHQMIVFNMAQAIVYAVAAVTVMIFCQWSLRALVRTQKNWDDFAWSVAAGLSGSGLVVSVIVFFMNVQTILKCWLAPKYYVLEQIMAMVKPSS